MGANCTVQTKKFFSERDKKKMARVISKTQVSDPGPSWPSCFILFFFYEKKKKKPKKRIIISWERDEKIHMSPQCHIGIVT